jgi:L-ascorbate metabolism protein UlaG (beta-lactamase superfamily)
MNHSQPPTFNSHIPTPNSQGARFVTLGVVALLLAAVTAPFVSAQGAKAAMQQDPACQSLMPVSAGGPAPKDPDTLVIRWLGWTNYELAYRSDVFLLDAYYDRGPRMHPIGVTPKDFKKANAIFIGHAHFDHISDAATVAKQTGAQVVGASFASEVLTKGGAPAKQFKAVKGGEVLQYPGVTVEAALGHHNVIATTVPEGFLEKQAAALQVASLQEPLTDAEKQQSDAIRTRGSRDPKIATDGVINYLFTFGSGFRLLFADSPGPITDAQRALAQKTPVVDVAMFPYYAFEAGLPPLVDLVKTFKPSTVFLGHHDSEGTMKWASNYPAALAIRDANPKTRTMDVIYRTPVCFNTTSKEMIIGW